MNSKDIPEHLVDDKPPYAEAHAADFVDGDEDVYTLVGQIIWSADESGKLSHHILVGEGLARPVDPEMLPLFEFFQTPRSKREAEAWLEWWGATPGFLNELVTLKLIVSIDPRNPSTAAKGLSGLKLVAQSAPGETEGGQVGVMSERSEQPVTYIGPELARAMWGDIQGDDIPTVVKKIRRASGDSEDLAARKVISEIPMLLEYGHARLEWQSVPSPGEEIFAMREKLTGGTETDTKHQKGEIDRGPHAHEPPAKLIEADSPVYVLVGGLLLETGAGENTPIQHLVAPGIVREFDPFFLPMFQFFRVARTEQQAIDWLSWAGAPDDTFKDLVDTGMLVRVDTTSPLTAAASFKGIRIIPQSLPGEPAPDHPTQISVRRDAESPIVTYIPMELQHVLWDLDKPLDIPTAIKSMAREAREQRDLTARRVITNIPALLRLDLARLEWLNAPRI